MHTEQRIDDSYTEYSPLFEDLQALDRLALPVDYSKKPQQEVRCECQLLGDLHRHSPSVMQTGVKIA
jgi:hypothetical protein